MEEQQSGDESRSSNNETSIGVRQPGLSAPEFVIDASVRKHYYTAASHRPLVRRIRITNRGFTGDADELLVSVHAEAVGAPNILAPWRRMYPMMRLRDSIDVDVLTLRPNMLQLASLDESVRGDVVITLAVEEKTVEVVRYPVEFLAYNQWFHTEFDYECLSSFVLPNHPAIADVMIGVRSRLLKNTGSAATEGYQSGSERVDQIVQAIYEELQSQGLNYSDPPASFEGYGQKIRTPDVILREKAMTCLDSTVLVASCLAAAGISPILFLVERHAFPGYWVRPPYIQESEDEPARRILNSPVAQNVNGFQLLDSMGFIGSLESTDIGNSKPRGFAQSLNRHKDYAVGALIGKFEALIDVELASVAGVRRLPSRTADPQTGTIEITEDSAAIRSDGSPITHATSLVESHESEKLSKGDVPKRVRRWMDALLDISNSNPLVSLSSSIAFLPREKGREPRAIAIPMTEGLLAKVENSLFNGNGLRLLAAHDMPGFLVQDPTPAKISAHFDNTQQISIGPIDLMAGVIERWAEEAISKGAAPQIAYARNQSDFAKLHTYEVSRRFKALKRYADQVESESATNQLFLTIGSLVWESPGDAKSAARMVKSPLFMIPIRIGGSAQSGFSVQMEESGEISPNYCLVEKLRQELGLHIPDLETPNLDDAGIDVDHMIASLRSQLSKGKYAAMRVETDCQLAVLDFATFRMWKDLQLNWRTFTRNEVVNHLVEGTNATLEQDVPEFTGEPLTPFDGDESQLKAVRWALEGRSFVLEGPPGTGKSQTIANMIAAGMAEGKRILFVAEKQVALEAVSRKLEEIGLDPFCITMHHESTTPESIRSQLQASLDFVGQDLSTQWASESTVVSELQQRVHQYRESVIATNTLGSNAITANQEVIRLGDGPAIDVDPATLPEIGKHLAEIRSALLQLRGVAGASRVSPAPEWQLAEVDNPENLQKARLGSMLEELQSLASSNKRLYPVLETLIKNEEDDAITPAIESALKLIASGDAPGKDVARVVTEKSWISRLTSLQSQVDTLKSLHGAVLSFFTPAALQMDVAPQLTAASEAMSAGLFSRKKKAETLRGLVAPLALASVDKEPAELFALLQQIAPTREAIRQLTDQFKTLPHLDVRPDFNPLNDAHLAELVSVATGLLERAQRLLHPEAAWVVHAVNESSIDVRDSDLETLNRILKLWDTIRELLGVSSTSQTRWRNGREIWSSIIESLPAWVSESPHFTSLARLALVNRILVPLRLAGQHKLVKSIVEGEVTLDNIHDEFERGLFRAVRDERLNQGQLATFDRGGFDKAVADFTRRHFARRQLMRTVIPRQLSETRPFKPGIRTGAIGNLERELGRKVRRVSIPKLMQAHGEMITRLTPCFLMSPEAVSRLLPAESQYFDLVVFDEASQIRVAAAIPAMGRGKAVVVVGDSKQMPPSRKIGQKQVSAEDAQSLDDDGATQDLESILSECSESHLPSLMLQCHFRSQHEGLIAFSNRNFYDSKLVTFPAPNTDRTTPISWIDVPDGEFLRSGEGRGTNPAEARAVVTEIQRRLNSAEHGSKSIGVVTFNEFQSDHILELLEELAASDSAVAKALTHPKKSERLFVVPLEKVQGDERDTIMLSVSYSYQGGSRTKVSPQWGPLTHKGGERRLNVAITRAKKDLVVICSFDPNHVDASTSAHLGVPATVEFLKECRAAAATSGAALKARAVTNIDRYRKDLFEQLRAAGIRVRENVGLSRFRIDLAISDETGDSQFLAVLLDTEEWASRSTPYDREVLPNTVLRMIGWRRIGRVWLKASIQDPSLVAQTVQNELTRERMRVQLAAELRTRGFEVRDDNSLSRIGLDLAVRRSGQKLWPLAVAITGPNLFAQFLTHEGEVPRGELLDSVSCADSLAVWLPDLIANQDDTITKIESAFERASQDLTHNDPEPSPTERPSTKASKYEGKQSPVRSEQKPLLTSSEYWSEFADARTLPQLGAQAELGPGVDYNKAKVKRAVDEIVEFEGPITEDRLASITAGRFGMSRVKEARLKTMREHFRHLPRTKTKWGVVYWPSHRSADTWTGFRTSSAEHSRAVEDVPAEEHLNAMVAVVRMGDTATEEEILRFLSDAHDRKLTEKVRKLLTEILAWGTSNGRLVLDGTYYKLPEG